MKTLLRLTIALIALLVFAIPLLAQQNNSPQAEPTPLVRLLQSKGIITAQEAAMINQAPSHAEAEQRLAKLLLSKGIISQQEYEQTISALGAASAPSEPAPPRVINAEVRVMNSPVLKSSNPASGEVADEVGAVQPQAQPEGAMTTVSKIPVKI
jgi:hypothetical protein